MGSYNKESFTQILLRRETKSRLDSIKQYSVENLNKPCSYNDVVVALLDSVVASGGSSFLLVK